MAAQLSARRQGRVPAGQQHLKTPKIISLSLGMQLKPRGPKVQQVLDAKPLRPPGTLHEKHHAKLSCFGALRRRVITDLLTPQRHLNPKGAQITVSAHFQLHPGTSALLTGSALGSQAILDGSLVLHRLIHAPDPSCSTQSLVSVPCSNFWALNSPSVSVSCPERLMQSQGRHRHSSSSFPSPDPRILHKGFQENWTHSQWVLKLQKYHTPAPLERVFLPSGVSWL